MLIDLRSDTVTKPSPAMKEAMLQAPVGDDVFGEDPTVARLEQMTAALFGMDAGLFFPSGTMANQAAIIVQTRPRQEIICDRHSHVYLYEGGGLAFHSGLSTALLDGDRGRLNANQVKAAIRADNIHYPVTSIVSLENTHNRGGGSVYRLEDIAAISELCKKEKLALHLDGARVFNAIVAAGYSAADLGQFFDTISVCLSKGLGAPVGSVIVMRKELLPEMKRVRKVLGGGMRQSGILAAAGIYALEHNIEGLKTDHRRAQAIGNMLSTRNYIKEVVEVDTNIVVGILTPDRDVNAFVAQLETAGVKAVPFGPGAVRMVTHLDFTDAMLDRLEAVLKSVA